MHDGLYVGARLGAGWLKLSESGYDGSISGWGWPFALSVGYALTPNLVVFGEFYALQVRNPSDDGIGLVDLYLLAVGPGATYYLNPSNVFASCSVSLAQASYRNGSPLDERYGTNETSHWGVSGRLALGKEWWISNNWGLGLAGELQLGRMGSRTEPWETNGASHFTVKGFSLLATASFN
jgi:hypothetical protein